MVIFEFIYKTLEIILNLIIMGGIGLGIIFESIFLY